MREEFTIPMYANIIINEYMNLRLGGKKVVCPYFINTAKERAGLRALIGKGEPAEIEKEVLVWAKLKDFDLKKAKPEQIREFMMDCHIGIDCSGFVVNLYNFWLKHEGKKSLIKYLKFEDNRPYARLRRFIRPVENIGANTLTSEQNCDKITNLNEILPGDLIRSKGLVRNADHVMIITKVIKEDGKVVEIEYTHSVRHYGKNNGIKVGNIIIKNPKKGLEFQDWQEQDETGRKITLLEYKKEVGDNGVRRLRFN
jgi:hypothetical protein